MTSRSSIDLHVDYTQLFNQCVVNLAIPKTKQREMHNTTIMTTTWQSYPLMHVNRKHIHDQPYINPNKSYKPEFVRLKDQPGGQSMWQASPTTSPWPVWDCALSATLSNWAVHVAAHSINLRSAYSWISLISAVCNSQAPFDLYFQRLRDLDLSTSSVLSVYMMSIWSLPAFGRPTRCTSWSFSSTFRP